MTALDCPYAAEVERLLDSRIPERHGSKVEGPVIRGTQSAIYRATCPGFHHPLLVKRLYEAERTAQSQYEALCFTRDRMQGQCGLSVPEVYPYLLDDGFIMMEWFAAPTVKQLLQSPALPLSRIARALERTGKWLAAFHGKNDREPGHLKVEQLLTNLLEMVAASRSRENGSRFAAFLDLLKLIGTEVEQISIPISYSHGDFKPDNVLVDGCQVMVIDMGRIFRAPIIQDLTHFLVHLDMHLMHPAGWRFLPWRLRLRSIFLGGYGLEITDRQSLLLKWLELQRVLQMYYESVQEDILTGAMRGRYLIACYSRCAHVRAANLRRAWHQTQSH